MPKYLLNLVLIGIEYDDRPKEQFDDFYNKLHDKISEKGKLKTVILFPVQAIEHWLLFIKNRHENPNLTKNISGDIEKIPRKEAKQKVDPNRRTRDNTMEELLLNLDISWLRNQSRSFLRFHERLTAFMELE